ncbi:hypothetical protein PTKIN_Ptkin19aG0029000 [Pterospermum kingtungense]
MMEKKNKAKAIIVGGSIGGGAMRSLQQDGKLCSLDLGLAIPTSSSRQPCPSQLIRTKEQSVTKMSWNEEFNFRAAHWADLHGLLYNALPPDVFFWGHQFISFSILDGASVKVKAKVVQNDEMIEIGGNLLVAADGCLSSIRQTFIPDIKLRYLGYCAWRGVLEFSGKEDSETIKGIRKAYPELGKCLYFDLSSGTHSHSVLYQVPNKRLNWIFYVNQPEPEIKVKVLACSYIIQIFWDNVVLIGDAAHPISPHGARSTNMAILDAAVLGKCLEKWGLENLQSALEEYQSIRLPVTSKQCALQRDHILLGLPSISEDKVQAKVAQNDEIIEIDFCSRWKSFLQFTGQYY